VSGGVGSVSLEDMLSLRHSVTRSLVCVCVCVCVCEEVKL
jgi:hypothetical protein